MGDHEHRHVFGFATGGYREVAGDLPAVAGGEADGAHLAHLCRVNRFSDATYFGELLFGLIVEVVSPGIAVAGGTHDHEIAVAGGAIDGVLGVGQGAV